MAFLVISNNLIKKELGSQPSIYEQRKMHFSKQWRVEPFPLTTTRNSATPIKSNNNNNNDWW